MTDIRLRSIAKSYGRQAVLHDVDLVVPQGAVLALLGPSGCGKTTLLRLVAGFDRADRGEIALGQTVVDSRREFVPPERRHVGYVPQDGALFPHLTVAGNVGYGLARGEGKASRVREVLDLVGLADLAERYPRELSGGQQQRVALARALAPDPALILLDEPFNALDLDLRRRMSEQVVALLRQAGTTSMLVTHDPAEAFATADLVAVMHDGRIVQCGSPRDVYGAPNDIAVARLTGASLLIDGVRRGGKAETLLGTLPIADSPGPAQPDGGRVLVLLRPEQLRLAPPGEGREATVVARRYQGDHTVLVLRVDDLQLTLRTDDPADAPRVHLSVKGPARVFPA